MSYDKESFFQEQPRLAKFFTSAREQNRLSHAFLLYGEPSAPLKETALYLAKSLQCQNDVLACNSCSSCLRFNKGTHPDFLFIDGSKSPIKKADVDNIADFFALTSFEKNHVSSYIINHAENISVEAINALLKTLEEPSGNTVAFLTTDNKSRVLPTILSRCEAIEVKSPDLVKEVNDYKGDYDRTEYFIVSHFAYGEEDKAELIESKEFGAAYEDAMIYLRSLSETPKDSSFVLLNQVSQDLKGSKCYTYFYSVLAIVFWFAALDKKEGPLKEMAAKLSANFGERLLKAANLLQEARTKAPANLNFTLMCARL